jgi:hypothetical protein
MLCFHLFRALVLQTGDALQKEKRIFAAKIQRFENQTLSPLLAILRFISSKQFPQIGPIIISYILRLDV